MCAADRYLECPGFFECNGTLNYGSRGINHIVEDDDLHPFNITNDIHYLGFIGTFPPLIDDRQIGIQSFGESPCPFNAACVRRDNHQILSLTFLM